MLYMYIRSFTSVTSLTSDNDRFQIRGHFDLNSKGSFKAIGYFRKIIHKLFTLIGRFTFAEIGHNTSGNNEIRGLVIHHSLDSEKDAYITSFIMSHRTEIATPHCRAQWSFRFSNYPLWLAGFNKMESAFD